jgi:CheY-like chemotaxis protein
VLLDLKLPRMSGLDVLRRFASDGRLRPRSSDDVRR